LVAQELPLKADAPGVGPYACPSVPVAEPPDAEEAEQARQLASTAAQSLILGDLERARALLDRATELDPSSAELAYRHARVLEDMGERDAAASEFCRVLAVNPQAEGVDDARTRLETLAGSNDASYPPDAIAEFEKAVQWAQAGFLQSAMTSFGSVVAQAPTWPEAVYDRAIVAARLGRNADAVRDLRRYLELRPGAPDAIAVSQRIGELQSTTLVSAPSPGAALVLGVLVPGMGQFYSGRALGGLTVFSLVGGAAAAGYFVKDVQVKCLSEPGPDGSCPEGQVLGEEVDRPYLVAGLGAAAAIGVIGAIEAYVKLRHRRGPDAGVTSVELGGVQLSTLDVASSRGRLDLRLVRLTF
jgi:tetratricopeptide (TPR) repeat protein